MSQSYQGQDFWTIRERAIRIARMGGWYRNGNLHIFNVLKMYPSALQTYSQFFGIDLAYQ